MARLGIRAAPAVLVAAFAIAGPAGGQDAAKKEEPAPAAARPLPFSDDVAPPPRLPVPLDRHLRGDIQAFDGERLAVRWDWSDAAQLEDFETFVPVRYSLTGGVVWGEGVIDASGTSGLRARLGFKPDLTAKTTATLVTPHDLGLVLASSDSSDETILHLIQDKFFTNFDRAAGNANMINKLGGVPPEKVGVVEFRYVDRKPQPKLARGDVVTFTATRKAGQNTFVIATGKKAKDAVTLTGPDPPDSKSFETYCPGIYTSGGAATFGPFEIEGAIDPEWFAENDVLPHVIGDLLHRGNGFKGRVRTEAKVVEDFLAQPAEAPEPVEGKEPELRVDPERVAQIVGKEELPLVIRIRAAEALLEQGFEGGVVEQSVAALLDARTLPTRVLAWQVLRPKLPWHFRYEPDGDAAARREGALLVAHYLQERDDAVAEGRIFVDGYWQTAHKADALRAEWKASWDLRTPRVRVRTNLPKKWADYYVAGLEAIYADMRDRLGREPPASQLPLSLFVFHPPEGYDTFCKANGYPGRVGWKRFADLERGVCFVAFDKRTYPGYEFGQFSKLFLYAATGRYWPTWYEEGRAAWFGHGHLRTSKWSGTDLEVGLAASGPSWRMFQVGARDGRLWTAEEFLARDPRDLQNPDRARWYTHAWALHHYLVSEAPEELGNRFARWLGLVENTAAGPRVINEVGRKQFLQAFEGELDALDEGFRAWVTRP